MKTNKKFFNIEKEKEKINLFTNIKHDDKNEMLYEDQIKRFSKKRNRYKNKGRLLLIIWKIQILVKESIVEIN